MNDKKTHYFDTKVLGQPSGLFFLFFTEMWERFSFYGMRVLLVQFLTAEILLGDPKGVGLDFRTSGFTLWNICHAPIPNPCARRHHSRQILGSTKCCDYRSSSNDLGTALSLPFYSCDVLHRPHLSGNRSRILQAQCPLYPLGNVQESFR